MTTQAAEPEATPATGATPTETTPQTGQPAEGKPLGQGGENALKAEREAKAAAERARRTAERERDEARAELAKAREKEMSDLERAQAEAQRFAKEATDARLEALRYRVAAKHQISDEDAQTFLTASDEDGITRQAERLAELTRARAEQEAQAAAKAAEPRTPAPDPSQGARGSGAVKDGLSAGAARYDAQRAASSASAPMGGATPWWAQEKK